MVGSSKSSFHFVLSFLFIILGLLIISWAFWPWIFYTTFEKDKFSSSFFEVPIDRQSFFTALPQLTKESLKEVRVEEGKDGFSYFSFPQSQKPQGHFWLSIEKLKIQNAKVMINSLDFDNNLAHFPGTSLPSEKGNVFITGHSSSPWLFSSSSYKTIFNDLSELDFGDEIKVYFKGEEFEYSVVKSKVVDPKDTSVLLPPNKWGRYLTLMSCVPPGVNSKRIIVLATLKGSI